MPEPTDVFVSSPIAAFFVAREVRQEPHGSIDVLGLCDAIVVGEVPAKFPIMFYMEVLDDSRKAHGALSIRHSAEAAPTWSRVVTMIGEDRTLRRRVRETLHLHRTGVYVARFSVGRVSVERELWVRIEPLPPQVPTSQTVMPIP